MCDANPQNGSDEINCSAKKTKRCKHGAQKSSNGSNKKCSKRNSTEKKSEMPPLSSNSALENALSSPSQEFRKLGSFRKDSNSFGERPFGSSSTTLKTGNLINIQVPFGQANNVQAQNFNIQGEEQMSPLNNSSKWDENQGLQSNVYETRSQQSDSVTKGSCGSENQENGSSLGKYKDNSSANQNCGPRSSTNQKCCSFKLPGSVCNSNCEPCEDQEESSLSSQDYSNKINNNNNNGGYCTPQEDPCYNPKLIDEADVEIMNGKRGTFKTLKFHKNPTTVTNLREKIHQYVTNRPDQMKPAPDKLTPFSDPVLTKCFKPIDEELERQLKEVQENCRNEIARKKFEKQMKCYKTVIPFNLPWKTQEKYLNCMEATEEAKEKFKEYSDLMKEADSFKKRMPSDWDCEQQMSYLDCIGVSDQVKEVLACCDSDSVANAPQCPCDKAAAPNRSIDQSGQQNGCESSSLNSGGQEQDICEMIQKCKKEFRASGLNVAKPQSLPSKSYARDLPYEKKWSYAAEEQTSNTYGRESTSGTGVDASSYQNEERTSAEVSYAEGTKTGPFYNGGSKNSYTSEERSINQLQADAATSMSKPIAPFYERETFEEEDEEEDPSDTESDMKNPIFGKQTEEKLPTLAEEMRMYKTHLANIRRRYFGSFCKEMDDAETITPDIAAAMVYSGELGISMKAAPEKVYDFLYPDAPGSQTINIADVMANLPKGLDDIVVPIVPPIQIETRNYPEIEDPAMLDSPRVIQIGPALNLIDEPEVKDLIDPIDIKELVTGHTSANYIELMFPEVNIDDLEEEEEDEEKKLERAKIEMFNIKLSESLPQHFSQVQMRGTIPPSWFPGYWSASPAREGIYKSVKPSDVMEYVWEEMQPERVRPAGAAYIIGN